VRLSADRSPRARAPLAAAAWGAIASLGGLGGCALVGFNFSGYGAGAGGQGGSTAQTSAGMTAQTSGGGMTAQTSGGGMTAQTSGGGMAQTSGPGTGGAGGAGGKPPTSTASTGPLTATASASTTSGAGGNANTSSTGSGVCVDLADCNDNNPCTDDACNVGSCVHTIHSCDDANACTMDFCDTNTGCYTKNVQMIDDGDPCTTEACDPMTGLTTHTAVPNCCPHSVCSQGLPLNGASCTFADESTNCVATICAQLPSCCATAWTVMCTLQAQTQCHPANIGTITCACSHSYCKKGQGLAANCDSCVAAVCDTDPNCCNTVNVAAWDDTCIALTHAECNVPLAPDCQ
jgi:hypothetical protein